MSGLHECRVSADGRTARYGGRAAGPAGAGDPRRTCFSGGEPFLHAQALAALAQRARRDGFEVVSYRGYTREELEADDLAGTRRLFDAFDLLIDGPFIQDQTQQHLFRGGRNQTIHFLSPRCSRTILDHPPVTEMKLNAGGKLTTIGTENSALHRIWSLLEQQGWRARDA